MWKLSIGVMLAGSVAILATAIPERAEPAPARSLAHHCATHEGVRSRLCHAYRRGGAGEARRAMAGSAHGYQALDARGHLVLFNLPPPRGYLPSFRSSADDGRLTGEELGRAVADAPLGPAQVCASYAAGGGSAERAGCAFRMKELVVRPLPGESLAQFQAEQQAEIQANAQARAQAQAQQAVDVLRTEAP